MAAAACDRDDPVTLYRAPKETQKPARAMDEPPATQATAEQPIQWTVPAGWKPLPAGQMRYAAFALSDDDPPLTLTVIPLSRQPLLPNVNRWEGQLGLPPSTEADLSRIVSHIDIAGSGADVVDLLGQGQPGQVRQRLLAAVLARGQQTWFFKMVGPAEQVSRQRDNFNAFIRSVRFAPENAP